jgi:hypothetical protein
MATENQARYAAKRAGLTAHKSTWRKDSVDNHGGFQLIDNRTIVVAGLRYYMTAGDVVAFCKARQATK